MRGVQLGQQLPCAADRAAGDGAEEGHKGSVGDKIPLSRHIAPADIHQIADSCKGVKADAQRQCELGKGTACRPEQGGEQGVVVFKDSEYREHTENCRGGEPAAARPLSPLDGACHTVGEEDVQCEHQRGERLPAEVKTVEETAGTQQHKILPAGRHEIVDQHHAGEKQRKAGGGKGHGKTPFNKNGPIKDGPKCNKTNCPFCAKKEAKSVNNVPFEPFYYIVRARGCKGKNRSCRLY